jgi:demethoxyubiquinone hydroxylase (CLK1/Coq7/Cat5 family)
MGKALLSLNFMHCMERFATQIYLTQRASFKDESTIKKLTAASENESTHVQKLNSRIKQLKGHVYPLGWLFQLAGVILGWITRLSGRRSLFGADIFVETRAVKDYNGFLTAVKFDPATAEMIKGIIKDEVDHIRNWNEARNEIINKNN